MRRRGQKAEPFSIRLRAEDDRFVKNEAERLRRSRSAIVEAYASEAIRMRRFPGIAFRGDDHRRRAWVLGTGLDVWQVISLLRDFGSEREVAEEYELKPGQIRVALAYYHEFRDEIDALIASSSISEQELRSRYPFIQTFEDAVAGGGA